jgi:hypothetical protein
MSKIAYTKCDRCAVPVPDEMRPCMQMTVHDYKGLIGSGVSTLETVDYDLCSSCRVVFLDFMKGAGLDWK